MSDDNDSRHGFGPFVQGIELVRFNHIDLENYSREGDFISAFMVEPIQGS